ncbi:Protein tyrosine phosphatase-like protein PTPLA (contains Pro instead of catalytic Arg) [Pseudoloma neurophilia]|uniref:Very-long-chain (3R)-3-hydroxyacyl-CoA dehydratase n=1 Tax=Pseudoloma neurophilia TaxID=146866 RepID=A0A0R0LSZ2_9MICR|nr:Protein tyrosine phosphatase-like protein PTPLA (contains Pro instead of catalytic Arg) [Pseudoloma neurophilia]
MLKYIDCYNSLGSLVGLSALLLITLENFYKTDNFLLKIGCLQTFYILELFNIIIGMSKAKIFPTILQLSSRLFIIWPICHRFQYTQGIVHLMLYCWFFSDTIRYLFYLSRNRFFKFLRYNLFLFFYPIGTYCEIVLVSRTESISIGLFKYLLRTIMLFYIPGFVFLFFHMLKRRKWTSKTEKTAKQD